MIEKIVLKKTNKILNEDLVRILIGISLKHYRGNFLIQMERTEKRVQKRLEGTKDLRIEYKFLFFFTSEKLLQVHEFIMAGDIDGVVHEISIIFQYDVPSWQILRRNTKV